MDVLSGQEGLYDNALMGILQNCGKLQPFLDAIFSFLSRRTDFYIIMQHPQAKMGFPPGVAEAMVQQVRPCLRVWGCCFRNIQRKNRSQP